MFVLFSGDGILSLPILPYTPSLRLLSPSLKEPCCSHCAFYAVFLTTSVKPRGFTFQGQTICSSASYKCLPPPSFLVSHPRRFVLASSFPTSGQIGLHQLFLTRWFSDAIVLISGVSFFIAVTPPNPFQLSPTPLNALSICLWTVLTPLSPTLGAP